MRFFIFAFLAVLTSSVNAETALSKAEYNEERMLDLLDGFSDVNEVREIDRRRNEHNFIKTISATPVLSAITLRPERLPELINQGASVNYIKPSGISPLLCASFPRTCEKRLGLTIRDEDSGNESLSLIRTLIKNGANPNEKNRFIPTVQRTIICHLGDFNPSFYLTELEIEKLNILIDSGAEFTDEELQSCKKNVEYHLADFQKEVRDYPADGSGWPLAEIKALDARVVLDLLDSINKVGLKQALSLYPENRRKMFSLLEGQRKQRVAERKRLQELNERKRREKMSAIRAYINQDAGLSSALSDIAQLRAERSALEGILLRNRFGAKECETRVDGAHFKSNACESSWEALMGQVKNHYSSLNTTYRKQRDSFSSLFGKNSALVEELVDEHVADSPSTHKVRQQYAPAFRQLRRITDAEASAERSARKRQEQQMMADFMNNIQNTFDRTNRMLDRNMAQTQRVVNQAYASQRSSGDYAGSAPQVRANAPAMQNLDKKLAEIDRSFSTNNGTKDLPDIGSAPVKPSYRVCGGPFTVPAMNKVFDIKALNSGKAEPAIECSAGGTPIMEGRYNPKAQFISWLMQPPNYKREAIRNENGRPSVRFRVSWDAFRYECLCSNSSGGQRSGSYQQ
tara:strand:- start:1634 stop:3520 length:1887 start_codon:yes stop_codon:yes gene_type:complete